MHQRAIIAASLLTIMLTACGSSEPQEVVEQIVVREPGEAAPVREFVAADLVFGEEAFQRCTACHSVEAGAPSAAGPNLHGIVGKVAGSAEGFPYSEALAAADFEWDATSLDAYLADPGGFLPGSEMDVGTVTDEAQRAAIVDYLASQSAGSGE